MQYFTAEIIGSNGPLPCEAYKYLLVDGKKSPTLQSNHTRHFYIKWISSFAWPF